MGGIYAIKNKSSGKQYIGSTKDFRVRRNGHFSLLRRGTHGNKHLQRSFDKYGEKDFEFVVLEETDKLTERERYWIVSSGSTVSSKGYNMSVDTEAPSRGLKWSAESKKRLSESLKKSPFKKGSNHPNAKLNEDYVKKIFELFNAGRSQKEIAAKIGIDHTNVSLILNGNAWSHVGLAEKRETSLNNKSGCTGVYFAKPSNKWKAEIIRDGIYHGLGYYLTKEEAITARKKAEVRLGI